MNEIIYVWEEKQLIELWDDLDKIQTVGEGFKKHYTGTIFLEESIPFGKKNSK